MPQSLQPKILPNGTADWTTAFDRRIQNVPYDWKGPLVEVLDTAQTVEMGIQCQLDTPPTAELIVGLTRLVMEEKARQDAKHP